MGQFADLIRGSRARRRGVPFRTLEGDQHLVDMQLIDGLGQAAILEYASSFARKRGGEAHDGEPLFDFGRDVMTVALGVIVHAEPPQDGDPCVTHPGESTAYFFSSSDEVLAGCDRDRIKVLADEQRMFQASVSPVRHAMSDEEYFEHITKIAATSEGAPPPNFFVTWSPSTQWSVLRTTALLLVAAHASSQTPRSSSGGQPESAPKTSSTSSRSVPAPKRKRRR